MVIAPATAHVLAKMAHGLADDFLSTMLLATTAPVIVAPAMNVNMWNHPATQANVALLRQRGVTIVEPGQRLSGLRHDRFRPSGQRRNDRAGGAGRACRRAAGKQDLAGETVLVTAGGTREAIDPVRFLGNRSSGKMGYALAEAARSRGAQVILVSAPTALQPPAGCAFVPVTSAEEMRAAVMEHLPQATVVIGAAAVADFRMPAVAQKSCAAKAACTSTLSPPKTFCAAWRRGASPGHAGDRLRGRDRTPTSARARRSCWPRVRTRLC